MTNSQHTPGNWQALRAFANNAPDYWLVTNRAFKGEAIAECSNEANARLIAAAPELLEQCQRMLNIASCSEKNRKNYAAALALTREVISKARGE